MTGRIKVMVIDDVAPRRQHLAAILGADPRTDVIECVNGDQNALELLARHKPDVATIDVALAKTNAFVLTRRIMELEPLPVVIVCNRLKPDEVATTFSAIEAGAVAVASRPLGSGQPDSEASDAKLVQTVKSMAEIKVVRRRTRLPLAGTDVPAPTSLALPAPAAIRVIAIGASTGGPIALQSILAQLPKALPVPVLIVQHIAPGFVHGLADWLAQSTGFPTLVAKEADMALPGHAYLAPDSCHMGVNADGCIRLIIDSLRNGSRPSISHLFASVTASFRAQAAGVLLTGMGRDGAQELRLMKDRGALTIAQNEESCVIYGMPGEAVKLNAAAHVLEPDGIAAMLSRAVNRGRAEPQVVRLSKRSSVA